MKRVKRRYLAVKIDTEILPNEREFIDAVWSSITKFYGEVGASQTGLSLIDFNAQERLAVIKVSLASLGVVRASLAAMTNILGREASLQVLSVSGTLKALYSGAK